MPLCWDCRETSMGNHGDKGNSELFTQYLGDERVKMSIPETVARWFYYMKGQDYSKRGQLDSEVLELTEEYAELFLKDTKVFVAKDFAELEGFLKVIRPYVMGLVGMQVWAQLGPMG